MRRTPCNFYTVKCKKYFLNFQILNQILYINLFLKIFSNLGFFEKIDNFLLLALSLPDAHLCKNVPFCVVPFCVVLRFAYLKVTELSVKIAKSFYRYGSYILIGTISFSN